jgi:hypothetical protein
MMADRRTEDGGQAVFDRLRWFEYEMANIFFFIYLWIQPFVSKSIEKHIEL